MHTSTLVGAASAVLSMLAAAIPTGTSSNLTPRLSIPPIGQQAHITFYQDKTSCSYQDGLEQQDFYIWDDGPMYPGQCQNLEENDFYSFQFTTDAAKTFAVDFFSGYSCTGYIHTFTDSSCWTQNNFDGAFLSARVYHINLNNNYTTQPYLSPQQVDYGTTTPSDALSALQKQCDGTSCPETISVPSGFVSQEGSYQNFNLKLKVQAFFQDQDEARELIGDLIKMASINQTSERATYCTISCATTVNIEHANQWTASNGFQISRWIQNGPDPSNKAQAGSLRVDITNEVKWSSDCTAIDAYEHDITSFLPSEIGGFLGLVEDLSCLSS